MLGGYPVISSQLVFNNGIFGTVDPFNANLQNNGALNPVGGLFYLQPGEGGVPSTGNGRGSGLWVKYVLYKSTDTTAVVTGPAPVYWTDETYTQVTDVVAESQDVNANSIAGWLMPNTTALGTAFTIAVLRNGGLGSYVFIGLQGFIAGASVAALTAKGDAVIGLAASPWVPGRVAAGTAPTNLVAAWALTAVAAGLSDVQAVLPIF
jgi:hypothetical protein